MHSLSQAYTRGKFAAGANDCLRLKADAKVAGF